MADDRSYWRLTAWWALAAAADAALVAWWGWSGGDVSPAGPRPLAFAALALAIGRLRPPQLLVAGLALLASGAVARTLAGMEVVPIVFALGVASLVLVAGFAIARLAAGRARAAAGATLVVALLALPFGRWLMASAGGAGATLSVMSSVPLGIGAGADGRALREVLERDGPVVLLDAVPPAGPATPRLLMVQPGALTGGEMVALDGWVRGGGRAVVLDDPRFDWSGGDALGAPGGPLGTSLLDPLMARWGVRLELPSSGRVGSVAVPVAGGTLALPSPGFFTRLSPDCALSGGDRIARCRVGAGGAVMVADADWADPRRWAESPDAPATLRRLARAGELRAGSGMAWVWWQALALLLLAAIATVLERRRHKAGTHRQQSL